MCHIRSTVAAARQEQDRSNIPTPNGHRAMNVAGVVHVAAPSTKYISPDPESAVEIERFKGKTDPALKAGGSVRDSISKRIIFFT